MTSDRPFPRALDPAAPHPPVGSAPGASLELSPRFATRAAFHVIDSHTAGHPTRVIVSGIPPLAGVSVRAQRDDFRRRFDNLRGLLLHEPRGHAAMFGLIPARSSTADYGAFFISSYAYLDMCGHATIGFAKTLVATDQLWIEGTERRFTLETPAGVVSVLVRGHDHSVSEVVLRNVPSRLVVTDLVIRESSGQTVPVDIAYGGNWYAIVAVGAGDPPLSPATTGAYCRRGAAIKDAVNRALEEGAGGIAPAAVDSVLFHTSIGTDTYRHLVVLADNKFDRSPCGTGTAARLAQLHARGALRVGDTYIAESVVGTRFRSHIREVALGDAVVAEIAGIAHITGSATLLLEGDDPLSGGFLCH